MLMRITVNGFLFIFLFVVINLECILGFTYYCETDGDVTNCYQNESQKESFHTFTKDPRINGLQNKYFYLNELPSNEDYQKYNNLELLQFIECNFKQIKKHSFKELNNLQFLIILFNNITDIDEKAFYNLGALKSLYLGFNRIKHIHKDAFYNLPNLEKISLEGNYIETLADGIFSQLVKLTELDLRHNPLKKLQENLFGENKNNFLAKESSLKFTADNMTCDSELLWVIEIYKKIKDNDYYLESNKCWLKWKGEGILELNINERYLKYFEAETMSSQLGQPNITSTSSGAQLSSTLSRKT